MNLMEGKIQINNTQNLRKAYIEFAKFSPLKNLKVYEYMRTAAVLNSHKGHVHFLLVLQSLK